MSAHQRRAAIIQKQTCRVLEREGTDAPRSKSISRWTSDILAGNSRHKLPLIIARKQYADHLQLEHTGSLSMADAAVQSHSQASFLKHPGGAVRTDSCRKETGLAHVDTRCCDGHSTVWSRRATKRDDTYRR